MRHIKSFNESDIFWENLDITKEIFQSWLDDLTCHIIPYDDFNNYITLSYDFVIREKGGMDIIHINIFPLVEGSKEHKEIISNLDNLISLLKSNFVDASFKEKTLDPSLYGIDKIKVKITITLGESE